MHDPVQTSPSVKRPDQAAWWRQPLSREIGLILMMKLVLIFALWWFFFDLPDNQHVDASQVGTHLTGTMPSAVHTPEENMK